MARCGLRDTLGTTPCQETGKPWEHFVPNARGCGIRPFADAARKPVSTGTECGISLNAGSHPPASFTPGLNSALPFLSKVRAVCTSSARTDLHGGPPARVVPTVTSHVANAGHHRLFMHIQTGTMRVENFHRSSSCASGVDTPLKEI